MRLGKRLPAGFRAGEDGIRPCIILFFEEVGNISAKEVHQGESLGFIGKELGIRHKLCRIQPLPGLPEDIHRILYGIGVGAPEEKDDVVFLRECVVNLAVALCLGTGRQEFRNVFPVTKSFRKAEGGQRTAYREHGRKPRPAFQEIVYAEEETGHRRQLIVLVFRTADASPA